MAVRHSHNGSDPRGGSAPAQTSALLYDHACGVCRVAAALTLMADRRARLTAVALQDPRAATLLAAMPVGERSRSWHLVDPVGRVTSAGAAIPVLCRLLPGFRGLGVLCRAAPDSTERVYAWLAGRRDRIGNLIPRRVVGWATGVLDRRAGPG